MAKAVRCPNCGMYHAKSKSRLVRLEPMTPREYAAIPVGLGLGMGLIMLVIGSGFVVADPAHEALNIPFTLGALVLLALCWAALKKLNEGGHPSKVKTITTNSCPDCGYDWTDGDPAPTPVDSVTMAAALAKRKRDQEAAAAAAYYYEQQRKRHE